MAIDAQAIYKRQKQKGVTDYKEEIHCPMIIDVMNGPGTMSAFCVQAGISDTTFYRWLHKYDVFNECYRVGCMIARDNWEREGELGKQDEYFNIEVWKIQGSARYGIGRTNRVRLHIDSKSTPYEQYQQLVSQASMGDFTASEFKQLVEGINIGLRAFEVIELQKEVDQMKSDLERMSQNHVNNLIPIAKTA